MEREKKHKKKLKNKHQDKKLKQHSLNIETTPILSESIHT